MPTKYRHLILALWLVLSFVRISAQDCVLEILDATAVYPQAIDCDSPFYELEIDIFHADGSDSFHLYLNDNLMVTLPYGPDSIIQVTLAPLPLTNVADIFIVDQQDSLCTDTWTFDLEPCIDSSMCGINDLAIEVANCTSDSTYEIGVQFIPIMPDSDSFEILANFQFLGRYAFDDLPLSIPNFPASGNPTDAITICLNDIPECCFLENIEAPNCVMNPSCFIGSLGVLDSCTADGVFYFIDFDSDLTSDSFTLRGNGIVHGTFAYSDLPVSIGPFEDADGFTEVVVIDQENMNCSSNASLSTECFNSECFIDSLTVWDTCTADGVFYTVFFEHANTSDSFVLRGNGIIHGIFAYVDLPVTIGPFDEIDGINELVAIDFDNEACNSAIGVSNDCFEEECPNCQLGDMSISAVECTEDSVWIRLDLGNIQEPGPGFELVGDGLNYGSFDYSALPVTLGIERPEDGGYNFIVRDLEHPNCLAYQYTAELDCESDSCTLGDATTANVMCEEDSILRFDLIFEAEHGSGDGFWVITTSDTFGPFDYQLDNTYDIEIDFPLTDEDPTLINVCDVASPNCCTSVLMNLPNCTSGLSAYDNSSLTVRQTDGILTIEVDQPGDLVIYDIAGLRVLPPTYTLDVLRTNHLANGVYIITHRSADRTYSERVLVMQ